MRFPILIPTPIFYGLLVIAAIFLTGRLAWNIMRAKRNDDKETLDGHIRSTRKFFMWTAVCAGGWAVLMATR